MSSYMIALLWRPANELSWTELGIVLAIAFPVGNCVGYGLTALYHRVRRWRMLPRLD